MLSKRETSNEEMQWKLRDRVRETIVRNLARAMAIDQATVNNLVEVEMQLARLQAARGEMYAAAADQLREQLRLR